MFYFSGLFSTDILDGRLRIIRGPFFVYMKDYEDVHSDVFKLFSIAFTDKVSIVFQTIPF